MNNNTARLTLALGLPTLIAAAGYLPYLLTRADLPQRLATHFDASGTPDGSMTTAQLLTTTSITAGLGFLLCIAVAGGGPRLHPVLAPVAAFIGAFIATLATGVLATTALSQRHLDDWRDADASVAVLLVAVVGALLAGAAAARLTAVFVQVAPNRSDGATTPKMTLTPGEQAVWSETIGSRWMFGGGLVALVVAAVSGVAIGWPFAIGPSVVAAVLLSFGSLRVTADRRGLSVRYGAVPWPRTDIAIERLATASVIDVKPMKWGGWGYRGSLTLMRTAAVVLRAGPGIRLDMLDGRVFVVTVDNPQEPVALLNAEIARRPVASTAAAVAG